VALTAQPQSYPPIKGGKEEMGRLANYAISVITTIVTIVTFVGFLTSKPLNTWTKTHSEVIFYALIFFFMATGASLNYLIGEKKKYRKLEAATARVKPSEHDRKLFQSFMAILPPGGPIIVWLKETSVPNAFLHKDYDAIETVLKDMRLQSPQFDNSKVETSYGQLHAAMQKFKDVTLQYMRRDPGSPWLRIPPEWDGEHSARATGEIKKIRTELIAEYDNFLELAHQNGIDE
jgi:hypothetical protein